MKLTCLVTGAHGFIGRNLCNSLRRMNSVRVLTHGSQDGVDAFGEKLDQARIVFHLAGANRPENESDFEAINSDLTARLAKRLRAKPQPTTVVFSSSAQATSDNRYGISKRAAENHLISLASTSPHAVRIYRLPGVFGKWSRPNYNTVVATFCHQVARGLPIQISDPNHQLNLVYIDDVVNEFLTVLDLETRLVTAKSPFGDVQPVHQILLGQLAETIRSFPSLRSAAKAPAVTDPLTKKLYSTYLSFLPEDDFAVPAELKEDDRGWLFELIKSESFGQIFVSTTKPGVTRGNHYHDSKVERFCLIQGRGVIRFRAIDSDAILDYPVNDQQIKIVDIPPGLTHSIENVGESDMIVLFWANEIFDPDRPDTYWDPVLQANESQGKSTTAK